MQPVQHRKQLFRPVIDERVLQRIAFGVSRPVIDEDVDRAMIFAVGHAERACAEPLQRTVAQRGAGGGSLCPPSSRPPLTLSPAATLWSLSMSARADVSFSRMPSTPSCSACVICLLVIRAASTIARP